MKFFLTLVAILTISVCVAQTNRTLPPFIRIESPVDYQVIQRHSRIEGKMVVTGTIDFGDGKDAKLDRLEARLFGESMAGKIPDVWQQVPYDNRASTFRFELTVPSGGWYRLEVRAMSNGVVVATAFVEHVGVGEIFVVAGQSNSANYGEERQTNHTGMVAAFDGLAWRLAGDPEPGATGKGGSFMPQFGDRLAENFHVPIGLMAQGIGSTSVREWLPSGIAFTNQPTVTRNVVAIGPGQWESTGKIFSNFTARLKRLGPQGFRAVLWHQGESDANQAQPERTLPGASYRQLMETLIRETDREIGWKAPWFVAQASYHNTGDAGSPDLRGGQRALWESSVALEGPDTDTLTGNMREKNGTGIHLSAAGLHAHGKLWAEKVIPWLNTQLAEASR